MLKDVQSLGAPKFDREAMLFNLNHHVRHWDLAGRVGLSWLFSDIPECTSSFENKQHHYTG